MMRRFVIPGRVLRREARQERLTARRGGVPNPRASEGGWTPLRRLFALLLLGVTLPGYGGCRGEAPDAEEREGPPQPAIESRSVRLQPAQEGLQTNAFKPGHWGAAAFTLRANLQDLRGELVSEPAKSDGSFTGRYDIDARFTRPAVLPRGQAKQFQLRFLLPTITGDRVEVMGLATRFTAARQGLMYDAGRAPVSVMRPEEYFFVGLSERPDALAYLRASDWALLPSDDLTETRRTAHYRVVFPGAEDLASLPDSFAAWTSTAFLCWDQLEPERLTDLQQRAVLDWLHWGGRILVNSAGAVSLRDSFLGPHLPLQQVEPVELDRAKVIRMVEAWSVEGDQKVDEVREAIGLRAGMVGVDGRAAAGASPVPDTAGLVWERPSGRGRIIMTRFDLSERWFIGWPSNQSFVNAAILRRAPRAYRVISEGEGIDLRWAGPLEGSEADPELVTGMRIFARDAGPMLSVEGSPSGAAESAGGAWRQAGWDGHPQAGLGGWHAASGAVVEARRQLQKAAGIAIPRWQFVARTLAGYLAVLVLGNFALFWLLGRLEWAWAMIPLIALGGAVWVTREARLDIGFSRSANELAILELQAGHQRGHLTRVLAIYNSLSSSYEAAFATRDAVITPLGAGQDAREETGAIEYQHGYADGVSMTAFAVPSNRTRMLRSEEMVVAGGGIRLGEEGSELENQSLWELSNASVWRLGREGLEVAIVGALAPQGAARLRFVPASRFDGWGGLPLGAEAIMEYCLRAVPLVGGETRLIARVDGRVEGMGIDPSASQGDAQTIVLAHLQYPELPSPSADRNLRPVLADAFSGTSSDGIAP